MRVIIQGSAEIALRSLSLQERSKLQHAIELLLSMSPEELMRSGKLRLQKAHSGENIYVYRGTQRLRVVLSRTEQTWIVEDIVDHERLDRLLPKLRRS